MNVLRMDVGATVHLFNGNDGEWQGKIDAFTRRRCSVLLEKKVREQTEDSDVWLIFAPIKRARIDFVAAKATELGASALLPVFTEFTDVTRVNTQRLKANAIEASEQCGRLTVPNVSEPQKLMSLLADWPDSRPLFYCDETGHGVAINELLSELKVPRQDQSASFLIGPEGGFSRSELDLLSEKTNFTAIDLGPRILRADTAAIAALSCWQSVLGDWAGDKT